MRITELVLHPIAIADPPLRSSYGLHAPFALRTIVELKTDSGLTGFSETYGGDGPLAGLERGAVAPGPTCASRGAGCEAPIDALWSSFAWAC